MALFDNADARDARRQARHDAKRERLLAQAEADPQRYRQGLLAFCALALLLPLLTLLALAGFLAWDLTAYLSDVRETVLNPVAHLVLLGTLGSLVAALWMRDYAPEGVEITETDAPQLFAVIEQVRAATDGPALDRVFLSDDLNACITQMPSPGPKPGSENHLTLGIPLLQLLGIDEMRGVIAHEFGHLVADDGKLGHWLYRASKAMEQLNHRYDTGGANIAEIPLAFILSRLSPAFEDRAFPMMRQQEYAADRLAARVVGPAPLASALQRLPLGADWLHGQYWPWMSLHVANAPAPDQQPLATSAAALPALGWSARTQRAWTAALLDETDHEDTHPCLHDRLKALGVRAFFPQPVGTPAAALLGPALARYTEEFDRAWTERVSEGWAEAHAEAQCQRRDYAALMSAAQQRPLDPEELSRASELALDTLPIEQAAPVAAWAATQPGAEPDLAWRAAVALAEAGDPSAPGWIDRAVQLDPDLTTPAHALRQHYFRTIGDAAGLAALAA